MKIVLTGGGSGGHFFPIIAIAEAINEIVEERKLLRPVIYYIGPEPYDERALYENGIIFKMSPAGKMRRYFSWLNILDLFKTAAGIVKATLQLYIIYPDVVFSKGGYASFPTLFAAHILRIPVIIHESDSSPGRVNLWASHFARRIAISYPETATFFKDKNVAHTGNPVRRELHTIANESGSDYFKLDKKIPTVLVLGGSQGAQKINDVIIDALPKLVESYQIIHQTGRNNFLEVERTTALVLRNNPNALRYRPLAFLNTLELKMAAGAASLIISRAGSGSIFEIAAWGKPAILVPIPEAISHDQRKNAYTYARGRAAVVIDEVNLTPNLLVSEITRILSDEHLTSVMRGAARNFATPDAARVIASGIIDLALPHESA